MEIQVDGSGLDKAELNNIAFFTITPKEVVDFSKIKIEVDGPVDTVAEIFDNTDGSYDCEWEPKAPGEYKISILIDGRNVVGSPFVIDVTDGNSKRSAGPTNDAGDSGDEEAAGDSSNALCPTTKDIVKGPGLWGEEINPKDLVVLILTPKDKKGKPLSLKVEDIAVKITGADGEVAADIFDNGDDTYDIEWEPPAEGNFTVSITCLLYTSPSPRDS
eukprot:TRINITY_DN3704_c0_g2_i3.p1 TRINITY_DN3704_c0_g2~~TRINITY_DN3704_c0_g2_i3.p1  ORF type:complete len:217 (+),score=55.07 TRINITY_DN3704_c0_g2_i3:95-745(+)